MENLSKGQFRISKFVLYFEAQAEGRGLLGDLIEKEITKFSKGTTEIVFPSVLWYKLVQIMIWCNMISLFQVCLQDNFLI